MSTTDEKDITVETENDPLDAERKRLAERLAETRAFLGLSQQDVADATGLSRLVVSSIETGRRKVESVELSTLSRLYGQPVSYFLPEAAPKYGATEPAADEVAFIARAAKELQSEDRAELLRFAEFLRTYRSPAKTQGSATGDAADQNRKA
jgi:transcriptional regulator with XRE-family HTH domain